MTRRKVLTWVSMALVLSLFAGMALAFGVGNVDGVWEYVEDSGGATCDGWASVTAGVPEVPVDAIGAQLGETNYPTAADQTRTRKTTVCAGEGGDTAFASWNSSTSATWGGLGSYSGCSSTTSLVFSEYVYDQRSSADDYVGVEIYNRTGAVVNLAGYYLRLYTSNYQYTSVPLNSVSLANGDVWVLVNDAAAGQTTQEDQTFANSDGYRTVVLVKTGTASTVNSRSDSSTSAQGYSTTDENQVRYGSPASLTNPNCPTSDAEFFLQSGFGFDGINGPVSNLPLSTPFFLGHFRHYNNPIWQADNPLSWVDLGLSVPIDCDEGADPTFVFYPRFSLDETVNSATPCTYPTGPNAQGCADRVLVTQPANPTFTCSGVEYTVNILGFTTNANCTTVYDPGYSATQFLTRESFTNQACLWAQIDAPTADAAVNKVCGGFGAQDLHYLITVTNGGPGTAVGAKIVDTLPSGVSFASYTSQRTAGGVTTSLGTCSAAGQSVTCDLNGTLPSTGSDSTAKWVVDLTVNYVPAQPNYVNTAVLTTSGTDPNTANNSSTATCTPTAVELVRLEAWPEGRPVHVQWETAQEVGNAGFNLYRSNTKDGAKLKLNQELIPTQVPPGSPGGAVYDYMDSFRLRPGRAYFYWLEDVDVSGYATMHGPVRVRMP